MNTFLPKLTVALLLTTAVALAEDKVPLKIELPKPLKVGTPVPIKIPNLEPTLKGARPAFLVPVGTTNLAAGKTVTASDDTIMGTLDLLTDGDKAGDEGSWIELPPGKQWVQIDLAKESDLCGVLVWHYHSQKRAYKGVVIQVSDDPKFAATATTTIYNNDYENVTKLGKGSDNPYVESRFGLIADGKGAKGRYVRLYSNGNTSNEMNHYIEVEVYGVPQ